MDNSIRPSAENLLPVAGVLLAMCSVAGIISLFVGSGVLFYYVYTIAVVLIAAFGSIYIFTGCKKGISAGFFRWFLILNAISMFMLFLNPVTTGDVLVFCCLAVCFGGFCVLAIAKDLGEKKSKIIAGIIAAVALVCALRVLLGYNANTTAIAAFTTQIICCLSLIALIDAKYKDKKERGTH